MFNYNNLCNNNVVGPMIKPSVMWYNSWFVCELRYILGYVIECGGFHPSLTIQFRSNLYVISLELCNIVSLSEYLNSKEMCNLSFSIYTDYCCKY